jgi:hypothetical protein
MRGPLLLLKNPFFFGLSIVVIIALQAGISFFSVRSFLEGNLILGLACFFLIPILALVIGFYYAWFRRQRKVSSVN